MTLREATCKIDGANCELKIRRAITLTPDAPRLVVVSYMPSAQAAAVLRACVKSIQRFTPTPHELWVVDNNSPQKFADELLGMDGVNVILNRTEPRPPDARGFVTGLFSKQQDYGSYANALALEVAVRQIDADSRHVMTLHMDVAPCHECWLPFLLSKLEHSRAAAGVRMDHARTSEGVLHILGCLFDFQLFLKLGLNFWPDLPKLDVGDRLTTEFRAKGYSLFSCRNTLWQPELIETLEPERYRTLNVDRSLDDMGRVIFLHLGRGVRKSSGEMARGTSSEEWVDFVNMELLKSNGC